MKNFFGYNQKTHNFDGDVFWVPLPDDAGADKTPAPDEGAQTDPAKVRAALHPPLAVIIAVCAALVVYSVAAVVSARSGLGAAWENYPALLVIGGVCGVFCLCFAVRGILRKNSYKKPARISMEEATKAVQEELKEWRKKAGVPDDAAETDFLRSDYRIKRGEPVVVRKNGADYTLYPLLAYAKDGAFCLYDYDDASLLVIPFSEIAGVGRRAENVTVFGQGRADLETSYATPEGDGNLRFRPWALTAERNGEQYELLFPPYEAEKILSLCKISPADRGDKAE